MYEADERLSTKVVARRSDRFRATQFRAAPSDASGDAGYGGERQFSAMVACGIGGLDSRAGASPMGTEFARKSTFPAMSRVRFPPFELLGVRRRGSRKGGNGHSRTSLGTVDVSNA